MASKQEKKEYMKLYYLKNKKQLNKRRVENYKKNAVKQKATQKAWRNALVPVICKSCGEMFEVTNSQITNFISGKDITRSSLLVGEAHMKCKECGGRKTKQG